MSIDKEWAASTFQIATAQLARINHWTNQSKQNHKKATTVL